MAKTWPAPESNLLRPVVKQRRLRSVSAEEVALASSLIGKLSSENFEPENYDDEYRNLLALIDDKVKGRPITVPRAPAPARVIDLMDALKESHADSAERQKAN